MQSGNGFDLASIYRLLQDLAQSMHGRDAEMARVGQKLNELVETVNEHARRFERAAELLNEHSRKLDDLAEGLTALRATVSHYHNTVIGHGMLLNDFEERLKRVERQLDLGPAAA